jgi:hypothetical protein
MATRPQLPKVELPKVELPKVELPKFEMPKFEMPKFEMPKIDLTKVDVAGFVRDGAYATIGLGVIGVQQATELAKTLTTKVTHLVQRAA